MSEDQAQPETAVAEPPVAGFRGLGTEHRRFILWQAIVGAAVVNLTLNVSSSRRWPRRELRHGRVKPLGWTWSPKSVLRRLPQGALRRGLALGALCTAALGPPAVALIVLLGVGDLTVGEFVTYKAIFGVILGMLVTPIVGLWALSEAEPAEP